VAVDDTKREGSRLFSRPHKLLFSLALIFNLVRFTAALGAAGIVPCNEAVAVACHNRQHCNSAGQQQCRPDDSQHGVTKQVITIHVITNV
jgi:hypothetical protein